MVRTDAGERIPHHDRSFPTQEGDSHMSNHNSHPIMKYNDCLEAVLPDTSILRSALQQALLPELWAETDTIHLQQIHQQVPTQPALRIVCLHCELLDEAGEEILSDKSWYLTAYGWDKPFVAARAVHQPQMV